MKKMLAAATVLAFAAAPAMAEKMTIDFATAEGTATFVFDSTAGTYVGPDGTTGTYTFDEETSTLCGTSGGGELCATFEDVKQEVGHSSAYTASDGTSGTATVTAIEADAPAGS